MKTIGKWILIGSIIAAVGSFVVGGLADRDSSVITPSIPDSGTKSEIIVQPNRTIQPLTPLSGTTSPRSFDGNP